MALYLGNTKIGNVAVGKDILDANSAYEKGVTDGRQEEYDRFWDSYQQNGTRTSYSHRVFGGVGFDSNNFFPKYDIVAVGTIESAFYNWSKSDELSHISLADRLTECGVVLDTSRATNFESTFNWCWLDDLPIIDMSNATNAISTFANSSRRTTIRKIIVHEGLNYKNTFTNASGLVNVTFEGVIGGDGLDFGSCVNLSRASMESVINCLSDTTSSRSVTFSKTAVTKAFGSTTSNEWTALAATKQNWTISLV